MKNLKGLFDRFIDERNFLRAYQRIALKHRAGGVDGVSVETFGSNLNTNLRKLREAIVTGRYTPEPVQAFHVPKFNEGNEWRELGLPIVGDKVVQAALLQVVEDLAEEVFLDTSYGYRPGKGPQRAIRRVEHNLKNGKLTWVVHRDIHNCFDSLDHGRLLDAFSKLVRDDARLVELVALWCRMGIVDRTGHWRNVQAGVRQGQVISPLLANLYLHPLDELAKAHGWGWVRYADNFLIQRASEAEAAEANEIAAAFVRDPLKLQLNPDANPVSSLDRGFEFLGVYFQGDTRKIASSKLKKMERKIAWVISEKNRAEPGALLAKIEEMVAGWRNYYGFLNPTEQFAALDELVENSLRGLIQKRVQSGLWPSVPAEEFMLSSFSTTSTEQGRNRLRKIWRTAQIPGATETSAAKSCERKIRRQRRVYQRQRIQGGELFVSTPGHFIGCRGERVVVRQRQAVMLEVPAFRLQEVAIAARGISLSSDVVRLCTEKDAHINFLDERGNVFAVLSAPGGAAAEVALQQLVHRDSERGRNLARIFVIGKLKNQLALMKYFDKHRGHRKGSFGKAFREARPAMEALIGAVVQMPWRDRADGYQQSLMGLEGAFGSLYWGLVSHLLPKEIGFQGRQRQGAKDLVNSLLNYGYGILYARMLNNVIRKGLNPTAGFLHSYQPGRPVLVYDLVEGFRAFAVDRPIFTMLNRREKLSLNDEGLLTGETRKKVAGAVLSRLGSEVPFRGRRVTVEEAMGFQVLSLKDYLMKGKRYRPLLFRW